MAANPNPSRQTDAMWYLVESLLALEPGTKNGGTYANKPGYHNTRSQCAPYDYSVVDQPDWGGPSDKCAAIDWTFPEAQHGDYSRISVYTVRLLNSAQDMNDPRLNGWREFYGNADNDTYVEGWDCRYYCPATSDSSHLWHIHISENREEADSRANKDNLLSVLRGESVDDWDGEDMSAKDVWTYDVDPSGGSYSASGAQWTTLNRTGYLANDFAPQAMAQLNAIAGAVGAEKAAQGSRIGTADLALFLAVLSCLGSIATAIVVAAT